MSSWKRSLDNQTCKTVFLGDSITAQGKWEERYGDDVCVLAIPGTTVYGCLKMSDFIPQLSPKKIFVMVGVNNLANWNYESAVKEDYQKLIDNLKGIGAQIYIESILPACSPSSVDNESIVEVNKIIKSVAESNDCIYLDIHDEFLDENGNKMKRELTKDGIHLNENGFNVLYGIIDKYVK